MSYLDLISGAERTQLQGFQASRRILSGASKWKQRDVHCNARYISMAASQLCTLAKNGHATSQEDVDVQRLSYDELQRASDSMEAILVTLIPRCRSRINRCIEELHDCVKRLLLDGYADKLLPNDLPSDFKTEFSYCAIRYEEDPAKFKELGKIVASPLESRFLRIDSDATAKYRCSRPIHKIPGEYTNKWQRIVQTSNILN